MIKITMLLKIKSKVKVSETLKLISKTKQKESTIKKSYFLQEEGGAETK